MAYSDSHSPPDNHGRHSPSNSSSSSQLSPASVSAPLDDSDSHSRASSVTRAPPDHSRNNQAASKGGCWTCRLRRKKCDEQREGDTCKTCKRLTIECLGWGQKRPDWMRDKRAVEAYKANIKAQLTRAGLIRGQPRASVLQAQTTSNLSSASATNTRSRRRPNPRHRQSAPSLTTRSSATGATRTRATNKPDSSNSLNRNATDFAFGYLEHAGQHMSSQQSMMPSISDHSDNMFSHQMPAAAYSDPDLSVMGLGHDLFSYPPSSSGATMSGFDADPLEFDFGSLHSSSQNPSAFDFAGMGPSTGPDFAPLPVHTPSYMQEQHIMYFFEHVKKIHPIFAESTIMNITHSMINEEPQGALTNAICSLASLYSTRVRVAQGLEAPESNHEQSAAKYFQGEAYMQLVNTKQMRQSYSESDVLAALHLVVFSQMSGTVMDWQESLTVAYDWLAETGLPTNDNPRNSLSTMTAVQQLIVKIVMWLDVMSSLTLQRPPKYFALYKRLLGDQGYWEDGLDLGSLTGCPDAAMLAIAEVSALSHWKVAEQRKGCLSVRELIRRGDDIEQRLRQEFSFSVQTNSTPLHPALTQNGLHTGNALTENIRRLLSKIFRESALLYLYTVLNEPHPAVSEITSSADTIVQLLNQLPPSDVDRMLMFPICIAGCMTDDSARRNYLKGRLLGQDESSGPAGSMMRTRLLMEAVWQKRDVSGGAVDWREMVRERNLNLLLL